MAEGREFARHWMHNGWVTMDGEKMSKSLGNFTSLSDLLARSDARAYRLLVLRSHYRSPIEVTPDTVADAEAGLARLDEMARRFELADLLAAGPVVDPRGGDGGAEVDATGPDGRWPSPGSVSAWTMISTLPGPWPGCSTSCDGPTPRPMPATWRAPARSAATAALLCAALGLALRGGSGGEVDPATAELVRLRDLARAERDWVRADALRAELEEKGWVVEDGPDGTRIRRQ